jgi:multiple sugar transport system substrate-binding protein
VTTLRILCWGHRRAVDPFKAVQKAYAAKRPDVVLELDVRPLSDFEHQGMAGVVNSYDLIVYDHPFSGDVAENELFVPLDSAFPDLLGSGADKRYIGRTLESYRLAGRVWGAPIDAATQHAIYRPDLLKEAGEAVPQSWQEAVALGVRLRARGLWLGIAVETPHTLMTLGSLAANARSPWSTDPSRPLTVDRDSFLTVFDEFRELLALCPPEALDWNSIDLHEAMVARDDIVYCPSVYGYATYGEADMRRRLAFADFAGAVAPYYAGSTVGGTAVAVSRFSRSCDEALELVAFLLADETQVKLLPRHHGQPALLAAWVDKENDERFNGFYSNVRASMESVWIRPRHPDYINFQNEAGELVASGLRERVDPSMIYDGVQAKAALVRTLKFKPSA